MSDGTERPSKWIPMTGLSLIDAAHLGKNGEEASELARILFRIWIQGIDECDPETGKLNRVALAEEIADVEAMNELTIERLGLDRKFIEARRQRKIAMKRAWHAMLREDDEPS
jgi:hypothetical protein